jgi:hypothetical protein
MCLVVGDPLLVIDATVKGDVDAEGQQSHGCEILIAANAWTMGSREAASP